MELPPPDADPIPEPFGGNWYADDPVYPRLVAAAIPPEERGIASSVLGELGMFVPTVIDPLMAEADLHPPVLVTHDRRGRRIDEVVFHQSYLDVEREEVAFGAVRASYVEGWRGLHGKASRTLMTAVQSMFLMADQSIMGCPIGMSDAMARCLGLHDVELAERFVPRLAGTPADYLRGAMLLTERYGGSDVGANETVARHVEGKRWALTGEKWFASCPHSDLFLVLARPEGASQGSKGLALFLVPRTLDSGERNAFTIRRLKDKFGTRAMASGEIEFDGTTAWLVGDAAKGIVQMMDMVNLTRVAIANVGASTMRRNLLESVHHARHRKAFGSRLIEHALMQETLADMASDAAALSAASLHLASLIDRIDAGEDVMGIFRVITPALKVAGMERAKAVASEAMEVRGGNGAINEWPEARIARDIQIHAIWEGSPNTVALDVLRAVRHHGFEAFAGHAAAITDGLDSPLVPVLRAATSALGRDIERLIRSDASLQHAAMRRIARRIALLVETALLVRAGADEESEGSGRISWLAARFGSRLGGSAAADAFADDRTWAEAAEQLVSGGSVPVEIGRNAVARAAEILDVSRDAVEVRA